MCLLKQICEVLFSEDVSLMLDRVGDIFIHY